LPALPREPPLRKSVRSETGRPSWHGDHDV